MILPVEVVKIYWEVDSMGEVYGLFHGFQYFEYFLQSIGIELQKVKPKLTSFLSLNTLGLK